LVLAGAGRVLDLHQLRGFLHGDRND
jgi:hypothetical protein